jgi:hypothetical protein
VLSNRHPASAFVLIPRNAGHLKDGTALTADVGKDV